MSDLTELENSKADFNDVFSLYQPDGTGGESGEDLDDYKTAGNYAWQTDALAVTLSNCPTSRGFFMKVMYPIVNRTDYIIQIIIDFPANIYIRYYSPSSWKSWRTI